MAIVSLRHVLILFQRRNVVHVQLDSVLVTGLLIRLARLLGMRLGFFKFLFIDTETELLRHEPGQVDRETVGVVETPDIRTSEYLRTRFLCTSRIPFKELLTAIQCAGERLFFLIENLLDILRLLVKFGEEVALS